MKNLNDVMAYLFSVVDAENAADNLLESAELSAQYLAFFNQFIMPYYNADFAVGFCADEALSALFKEGKRQGFYVGFLCAVALGKHDFTEQ